MKSLLLCVFATASLSSAQTVSTIVNNGDPADLYDIVFVGDGYQSSEQWRFNQDVSDIVAAFQTSLNFPYDDYFGCFNVHTVFRASVDSGADHPDATPNPIYRDTAYDATYNHGGTGRCLYLGTSAGRNLATQDAALAPDSDGRIIVVVNDSRYGGCASTFSVSYNGGSMETVQAHEWGHSFGGLADEYDYGASGTYTGGEFSSPNVTNSPTGNKWSQWLGQTGTVSTVGAYEGARYYEFGVWRPETSCKMRSSSTVFCAVCREHLIERFHEEVDMIGDPTPTGTVTLFGSDIAVLQYEDRLSNASSVNRQWRVDGGSWVSGSNAYVAAATTLGPGSHTIEARITDTSHWAQYIPLANRRETHLWNVDVDVNVVIGSATPVGTGCPAGAPMDLYTFAQPTVGIAFPVAVNFVPTNTTATVFMAGQPTNLALDVIGMEFCRLYSLGDLASIPGIYIPGNPTAVGVIPLPSDPATVGSAFTLQFACIAAGSTTFGVAVSNGLDIVVGN